MKLAKSAFIAAIFLCLAGPAVADNVKLKRPGIACVSEKAHDELMHAIMTGNKAEQAHIFRSGACPQIEAGEEISVIDRHHSFSVATIRYRGAKLFMSRTFLN